jgi:hypothetical protein
MSPHVRAVIEGSIKISRQERDRAAESEAYHQNLLTEYREQRIIAQQQIDQMTEALMILELSKVDT